MGKNLPRYLDYSEKLLALAAQLRKRGSATSDPFQGDRMCRTAEGLEKAGARAKDQIQRKLRETGLIE
jgi:hypothetical protein